MPDLESLLVLLHGAATLGWAALAVLGAVSPRRAQLHPQAVAAALLAGLSLPLADRAGWWIDMPAEDVVPHLAVVALLLAAAGPRRIAGRLAAFGLAGFFLSLGIAALRNAAPLPPWLAVKAILLGGALLLLPLATRSRFAQGAIVLLLLAAAVPGVHRDLPLL